MILREKNLKKPSDSEKWYIKAYRSVYLKNTCLSMKFPRKKQFLIWYALFTMNCVLTELYPNFSSFVTTLMEPEVD